MNRSRYRACANDILCTSGHRWIDAARRLATAIGKVAANNVDRTAEMRPIKVAIIDDGVTPGRLSRPSALKDGWPFPGPRRTENRSKPYYHSEKGHGTKMARLIQMMCPYVSFYVAKVDMHRENNASVASSAAQVSLITLKFLERLGTGPTIGHSRLRLTRWNPGREVGC